MTMKFKRRSFLFGAAAAAATTMLPVKNVQASPIKGQVASLYDLTKCDGCADLDKPACVTACRESNADRFPEPDPSMLKDYWPQKKHEDWSSKKHVTNRLTPYNWTFVQKVEVEHDGQMVTEHVPRRCMHCDNPPCVKTCPFGALEKSKTGPVSINENICFGGAKCRAVCPWDVPQRQAGVGLYTYLDPMPVGGGTMFKCDLCEDKLKAGKMPACVTECPKSAIEIGERSEIEAKAKALAEKIGGHIYGDKENGGTSTFYVSRVPFEKLNKALTVQAKNPKKVMKLHKPKNPLEEKTALSSAVMAAPFVGAIGAFVATVKKQEEKNG